MYLSKGHKFEGSYFPLPTAFYDFSKGGMIVLIKLIMSYRRPYTHQLLFVIRLHYRNRQLKIIKNGLFIFY